VNKVTVYYRKEAGNLSYIDVELKLGEGHKEGILEVKEYLVQKGDCLTNKAVLAVIEGGKQ
jgi:hypothetical protein